MTAIAYPVPVYLPRRKGIVSPAEWLREKILERQRERSVALAVAMVQEQGSADSADTAMTLTFGANFTNGNMVVVCVENNDDATGPSISGTGITFTKHNYFRGDASHDNIILWTGTVAGGASNTITITKHGATWSPKAGIGVEFSGVQQVVDGTPPTPTNVASTTPSVTSNTPSVSGDLAVAFCGHTGTSAPTATPSGWTALTRRSSTNSIEGAWLALPDANAITPQWTFAASQNALLEIVLIKATAATASLPGRILAHRHLLMR